MSIGISYLSGLPPEHARRVADANAVGIAALQGYLRSERAIAILGAGASVPLYPTRTLLISELIDFAATRGMPAEAAHTCRLRSATQPDAVVEILRRQLGVPIFRDALRSVFRARRDDVTGNSWTSTHELVCRCNFKGIVTTSYDSGIVDARIRMRPLARSTGFCSWSDEMALDRWISGEVFEDDELPVLFAHGYHTRPDEIILATAEYRRAYRGKLGRAMKTLIRSAHLVWIGFSFTDQEIASVLREVAAESGTSIDPGISPRHVVIMPWDPMPPESSYEDPMMLRTLAEIEHGADLILYPAPGGDHSRLSDLLSDLTDQRFPAFGTSSYPPQAVIVPPAVGPDQIEDDAQRQARPVVVSWTPELELPVHFTGRGEELARLTRWAADGNVKLIAVTAWGGAGKTSLVARWLHENVKSLKPGIQGVFAWSFYTDPSVQHWATALAKWAEQQFAYKGSRANQVRPASEVLGILKAISPVLVLDGLEAIQAGPAGPDFGHLLDDMLRDFLTASCRLDHDGLVILTSRFPFADLERYDGNSARVLSVPPLSNHEGSLILAQLGGEWLPKAQREALTAAVDGHALALAALGACLADRPQQTNLFSLVEELSAMATTDERVMRVLSYYNSLLEPADRYLLAAVALFAHPVTANSVLAVAAHESFGGYLAGWTARNVEVRAQSHLMGLLSVRPDGSLSAHPLVRDAFRPLAMGATEIAINITLAGMPDGSMIDKTQGHRLVEAIELCLAAGQWTAADELYMRRSGDGRAWQKIPAARLGQRAAMAFIATPYKRAECKRWLGCLGLSHYLSDAGMLATFAGDLQTGQKYLEEMVNEDRLANDSAALVRALCDLAACIGRLGQPQTALPYATEALGLVQPMDDATLLADVNAVLGWLSYQSGDTLQAEQFFIAANIAEYGDSDDILPHSQIGLWWAEFLARTERAGSASKLVAANLAISRRHLSNDDVARCRVLLARLASRRRVNSGNAEVQLESAMNIFRDGDYLYELADVMVAAADRNRKTGALDTAEGRLLEAEAIAEPRQLLPIRISILSQRAFLYADRLAAGRQTYLQQGRDCADAALRMATSNSLAWLEVDALQAHSYLDETEGADHGWRDRERALRKRLVPSGLDRDPIASLQFRAAKRKISL
jgi:hypothetical protein